MNPVSIGATVGLFAAGTIAWGAVYPHSHLFGETVSRTNSPRKLAITFDDGPNPAITPGLLDLLDRYNAKATFFLIGRFVRECPEIARETASRGHAIGNHTETHPNLFWMGPSAIRKELESCNEAIGQALQIAPNWFRPPYGFRNPWVASTALSLGMRTAMLTSIPGDWKAPSAEWLIPRMQPIESHAKQAASSGRTTGDVLCVHDGGHRALNTDRSRTVAALEYWLPRWRDAGLEFVTMDGAVQQAAL